MRRRSPSVRLEWERPTAPALEVYRPANPITQLSDAKSPLMALHVPELRMMMLANESSADIPYWKRWPLRGEQPRGSAA